MSKCVICGKDSASECCSGACRAKKSRRTQAHAQVVRTVEAHAVKGIIIDACGKEHPIDYEGMCKDYEQLESWADGNGTPHQVNMGLLARHYRRDKPLDYKQGKGIDMDKYLGKAA